MSSVCWVNAKDGHVPPGAIIGGLDREGEKLYVGRAYHQADILPAKINPRHKTAYVTFGGNEVPVKEYEVMCHGKVAWACDRDGHVPKNAIVVGRTNDGEPLYVGRVYHEGTLTPGKVHTSHGVCYIPFGGKEIACKEYEVIIDYLHY